MGTWRICFEGTKIRREPSHKSLGIFYQQRFREQPGGLLLHVMFFKTACTLGILKVHKKRLGFLIQMRPVFLGWQHMTLLCQIVLSLGIRYHCDLGLIEPRKTWLAAHVLVTVRVCMETRDDTWSRADQSWAHPHMPMLLIGSIHTYLNF
jgi:hypothetical protein